jgi:hypothetical protein
MGEFLAHHRIVEQKTGNGHFLGLDHPTGHIGIRHGFTAIALGVERLVRIGDVYDEAERLARFFRPGERLLHGGAIGFCIFGIGAFAGGIGIEVNVPAVGGIGSGMGNLVADAGEVAGVFHQAGQMRIGGGGDLVKALDLVVMGVETRPHHIARGHAIADDDVGAIEAHRLRGEPVDVRRSIWQLATKGAERIGAHVIHGDDQQIEFSGGVGRREVRAKKRQDEDNDAHGREHTGRRRPWEVMNVACPDLGRLE